MRKEYGMPWLMWVRNTAAIAVLIGPGMALAQDRPAVGPPTTNPETDKNLEGAGTDYPTPAAPADEVLPAVPETAADPAPAGTNGVRVDLPNQTGAPNPAQAASRRGRAVRQPGVRQIEGVVTRIQAPGDNLPDRSRLIIVVDPDQSWEIYAHPDVVPQAEDGASKSKVIAGTQSKDVREQEQRDALRDKIAKDKDELQAAAARTEKERAETQTEKAETAKAESVDEYVDEKAQDVAEASQTDLQKVQEGVKAIELQNDKDKLANLKQQPSPGEGEPAEENRESAEGIPMLVTRETLVYVFARSRDGVNLFGAPTFHKHGRSNPTQSSLAAAADLERPELAAGPERTNFTNIREGSFVAVRFRQRDGVNEVLNLSLIELPLETGQGTTTTGNAVAPGAGSGTYVPGPPLPVRSGEQPRVVPRVPIPSTGVESGSVGKP